MADPFVGQINMFGFQFAPADWAYCNGATVSVSQFAALYSLIGNAFGSPPDMQHFKLPDLQGRLPMGQGTGSGLTMRTIGQHFGVEQTMLQPSQCAAPLHTHTLTASNTPSANLTQAPAANWTLGAAASVSGERTPVITPVQMYGPATPSTPVQSAPTSPSGGSQATAPVSLINPALVLNFCIALTGTYPPRN